jgi:hypothetical protein
MATILAKRVVMPANLSQRASGGEIAEHKHNNVVYEAGS